MHSLKSVETVHLITHMLKIGITGGIGSGKTTVAKMFELLHVPVYYADAASKRLYKTNKELMHNMKTHFGDDIYIADELNRTKLAGIVFNDPQKLDLLNTLVHPLTIQDAHEWMQQQKTAYVIKEAALLFESGSDAGLDYIIGVSAPENIRVQRVMGRDKASREEVLSRMKRQMDEEAKMKRCDFIIINNEEQLLVPQILEVHQKILSLPKKIVNNKQP